MKIKKTYQGAVPLNRISNQQDDSELNTYSTQYLNNKLMCASAEQLTNGQDVWVQKGKNLFYEKNVKMGYYEDGGVWQDGTDIVSYGPFYVKGTIYISANFISNSYCRVIEFQKDGTYIKRTPVSSNGPLTLDNNTDYIIVGNDITLTNVMITLEEEAEYEPYIEKKVYLKNEKGDYDLFVKNRVHVGPYQPEDDETVWIQTSGNLFNINGNVNISGAGGGQTSLNTVSGNVLTSNVNTYSTHNVGQKFTNLRGKTFTVSAKIISNGTGTGGYTAIYDNNSLKTSLTVQAGETVTLTYTGTTDNIVVGFATASGEGAQFTDIQVEIGNAATDFEPYIDKKIYIKNDNGVYEELCRAGNKSAILWENKSPTSNFGPQSIYLSSNDYDYLEFAFCPNTGNSEAYWFKVKKGHNITAQLITGGTSAVYIRNRICDRVSDIEYSLRDSRTFSALNAATSEVDNSRVIPLCVIGYKY